MNVLSSMGEGVVEAQVGFPGLSSRGSQGGWPQLAEGLKAQSCAIRPTSRAGPWKRREFPGCRSQGTGRAEDSDGRADGAPLGVVGRAENGERGDADGRGEVRDAGVVAEEEAGEGELLGQFIEAHMEVPGEFVLETVDDGRAPAILFDFAENEGGDDAVALEARPRAR